MNALWCLCTYVLYTYKTCIGSGASGVGANINDYGWKNKKIGFGIFYLISEFRMGKYDFWLKVILNR